MATTKTIPASSNLGSSFWLTVTILGIFVLIGAGAWVYQLLFGAAAVNTSDYVPWGLYIVMYLFFAGLGAGTLILSAGVVALDLQSFKSIVRPGLTIAVAAITAAGLVILADLGRPNLAWRIIINANVTSPLRWDFLAIVLTIILGLLLLWFDIKGVSKSVRRTTAWMVLLSGLGLRMVSGWLLSLQVARPYWHSPLIGPILLLSALVGGLSLLALVGITLRRIGWLQFDGSMFQHMARWLAVFLVIDFIFLLNDIVTKAYVGAEPEILTLQELVSGRLATLFWVEVLLGMAVPLALLIWRRTPQTLAWAASLAIIGIFLKLFNLLRVGYLLAASNLSVGLHFAQILPKPGGYETVYSSTVGGYQMTWPYSPSAVEITVVLGLLALFLLGSLSAIRYLVIYRAEEV